MRLSEQRQVTLAPLLALCSSEASGERGAASEPTMPLADTQAQFGFHLGQRKQRSAAQS